MHIFVLPAVMVSVYGIQWTLPMFWWHAHVMNAVQKATVLPKPR
jgi:hypothetical protein